MGPEEGRGGADSDGGLCLVAGGGGDAAQVEYAEAEIEAGDEAGQAQAQETGLRDMSRGELLVRDERCVLIHHARRGELLRIENIGPDLADEPAERGGGGGGRRGGGGREGGKKGGRERK